MILLDLIGERFSRLVVITRMDSDKRGNSRWLCLCDCGKEKIVLGGDLKSNNTKSCGCLKREILFKHGHSTRTKTSKIYKAWECMIRRCTNPNDKSYPNYGGRGIKVCARWKKFENFLKDMGKPSTKKHSLDRIDNNDGYCKSNCRWATPKQQQRNRSNNHLETYGGKTRCLAAWAEEYGIAAHTLGRRLKHGWSIEKTLTTLVGKYSKRRK